MLLFEVPQYTSHGHKSRAESTYEFWQRVQGKRFVAIRDLLETWFEEVPLEQRFDLASRFRSRNEFTHKMALFELFMHHFLLRCGFQLQFRPAIDGAAAHPDFLVSGDGQPPFYLDLIAASNAVRARRQYPQVYDALKALKSSDFYIRARVGHGTKTPPAAEKLCRDLDDWLSGLDWEKLYKIDRNGRWFELPTFQWKHNGWDLILTPHPKSEDARGTPSTLPIGKYHLLQHIRFNEALKPAVLESDRYGKVTLPIVVAVQFIDDYDAHPTEIMNGLLGEDPPVLSLTSEAQMARLSDGDWFSPRAGKRTNIGAVLTWPSHFRPWVFASVEPSMIHHPCATNPLPKDTFPITQYTVDSDARALVKHKGVSMAEVLGLAPNWVPEDGPEEEDEPEGPYNEHIHYC